MPLARRREWPGRIAGTNAQGANRKMQSRRTGIQRDGMFAANRRRKGVLESLDARASGQPAGLQSGDDLLNFGFTYFRTIERDFGFHGRSLSYHVTAVLTTGGSGSIESEGGVLPLFDEPRNSANGARAWSVMRLPNRLACSVGGVQSSTLRHSHFEQTAFQTAIPKTW